MTRATALSSILGRVMVLLGLVVAPASAQQPSKLSRIIVAFQPGDANSQGIIKQKGWFSKVDGVPVEYRDFNSGADVYRAMASGAIDFGLIGNAPFTIAVTQGAKYKATWWYDIGTTGEGLIARRSAHIDGVAGLKGKSVATPFGSTADYMLHGTLHGVGLDSGVRLLNLSPQAILAAWRRGDINAAYIWEPVLQELKQQGGEVIAYDKDLLKNGYLAGDLGVVKTSVLTAHPDIVRAWMQANIRAMDLIRNHPDEAERAASQAYGVSISEIKADFAGQLFPIASEQLKRLAGTGAQLYQIAKLLSAEQIIPAVAAKEAYTSAVSLTPLKDAIAH